MYIPALDFRYVDWDAVTAIAACISILLVIVFAGGSHRATRHREADWVIRALTLLAKAYTRCSEELQELAFLDPSQFRKRVTEFSVQSARDWIKSALTQLRTNPPPTVKVYALLERAQHALASYDTALARARTLGSEGALPHLLRQRAELRECCIGLAREVWRLGAAGRRDEDEDLRAWLPTLTELAAFHAGKLLGANGSEPAFKALPIR